MDTSRSTRTVVLTGANDGIGYQFLRSLVEADYRVAALDIEGDNIRSVVDAAPRWVRYESCDVSDFEAVDATIEAVLGEWDRIDILVNNAAVSTVGPFTSQPVAAHRREWEVNYLGYRHLIRTVLPTMLSHDRGIIHNVGSGTGRVGHPGISGYAATKGAIGALTRSLRLELQGTGVSCSLMVPPTTETRMTAELGYPSWMTDSPAAVGRKLAAKVESTRSLITPDRRTRIGLWAISRVPGLWRFLTSRYVEVDDVPG